MSERTRVLVADDEPDVLLLCRVNLEFEGYEVASASDGVEALERIRAERPDVVLLDVMMPRMDGWQVLHTLKTDPELRDIPVVLLTAKVRDQDQIRGLAAGAARHIAKPFSPLQLSETLRDVLRSDPEEHDRRRSLLLEKLQLLHSEQ